MKIKMDVEVDATPKEVRETLGLPDIQAVQERIIAKVEKRVTDALSVTDPTKLLGMFMPEGFGLPEGLQKMVLDKIPPALRPKGKKP